MPRPLLRINVVVATVVAVCFSCFGEVSAVGSKGLEKVQPLDLEWKVRTSSKYRRVLLLS